MLRKAVIVLGIVFLILAVYLFFQVGVTQAVIVLSVYGVILAGGAIFERSRYAPKVDRRSAEWRPTGERFVDPASGKLTEVYFNPATGERDYRPVDR
jgi:uncharacterized membrane protein HdeD (DUF308 family)